MATFDEILQAYTDFIEERAASVGSAVAGVGKAASALLGDVPVQAKSQLDMLCDGAHLIDSVSRLRGYEKVMETSNGYLWRTINDKRGLLENNINYATGRAKRTHQDALDALCQLNYKLDDFFHAISAPKEAQELEQWLIDNNKW